LNNEVGTRRPERRAGARGARVVVLLLLGLAGLAGPPARSAPPPELGEIKGKLIWVDFWASWCAPCRRSFPWLNQMQARYAAQGLQVIGVNLDEQRGAADAFLKEVPARFTLKFDPAGKLALKFNVQAMPSSFLLDASGNVLASHAGFKLAESAAYESDIKKALTGSK
jgi:thiol-disulfide isomerase/thioredoxin